ncbi:MAG TPA: class I SAM-dependent methyltransferase, partial [Pirellulaceae bacterium]
MSTTGPKSITTPIPVGPKQPPSPTPSDRPRSSAGTEDAASYNEVPYPSFPFRKSHPDQLHTLGRLFGMAPADTAACRVLEIGCAGGGNILPMADQLPNSEFVGLDYSEVQIRDAQAMVDRAGLTNVRVLAADVSQVDPKTLGQFDYILCHGVYSWVPPVVQNAILDVCQRCLSPQGIAFISFNTYPGWHFRGMIRDMMRYHVQQFKKAEVQINQARALLKFLAENANEGTAYGKLLKTELETLSRQSDSYLYHEHLESHNQPVYFHHFAEDLKRYHLQYLG